MLYKEGFCGPWPSKQSGCSSSSYKLRKQIKEWQGAGSGWRVSSVCSAFLTTSETFSTQAASQNSWALFSDPRNQVVPPAVSHREFLGCCGFHLIKVWALVQLAQGMCLAIIPGTKVRGKQRVMIWKEPHSKSKSSVGRGDWVGKRTEGTKVWVTDLFICSIKMWSKWGSLFFTCSGINWSKRNLYTVQAPSVGHT